MASSDEPGALEFPPLLSAQPAPRGTAPFEAAIGQARAGTDAGLIVHRIAPDALSAALVVAPEVPLRDAAMMLLVCAVGYADGFGSIAPSEVGLHFDWPGGFRVNGARCGGLRFAASTIDPDAMPDWMVIGLDVPFFTKDDAEPGADPDRTTLWEEGCAEIEPRALLECWARHMLVWLHDWTEDGAARLHAEWVARAWHPVDEISVDLAGRIHSGRFLGLDERGGLLLKCAEETRLLPLTLALEKV